MCGICGFSTKSENADQILSSMMQKIVHRGPDSEGKYLDSDMALGFRRLSIIDLEGGDQPLYNETGDLAIVFNGEIYNYKELREQLINFGHQFQTHSDTEVLVHAYEQFGEQMLMQLRGMFSFAIWNKQTKTLFAARDFFGIKPFYYTFVNGNIIFGSEIKSILEHPDYQKELNPDALESYLSFGYSVLPETFFKGIFKLKPGHYLVYKDEAITTERYFEPRFSPEKQTSAQATDRIDDIMQNSIEAHKISDVEVGSFLSSGVDSSFLCSCAGKVKTFTVGFGYDGFSEIGYAKSLTEQLGIENFSQCITDEEYFEVLPKVQYQLDEPLADASAVALYFVSRLASKYVKVVMSGEGADEFFGGYRIYQQPLHLGVYTRLPLCVRKFIARLAKKLPEGTRGRNMLITSALSVEERFIGNAYIFHEEERGNVLKTPTKHYTLRDITGPIYERVQDQDDVTKMQALDLQLWLTGDILQKGDKMSMAHSLELRVPFVDRLVWGTASTLPTSLRVDKKTTKLSLRNAARRHLPETTASRRKLGFPVPTRLWLRQEQYYQLVWDAFSSAAAEKFFQTDELKRMLKEHKSGQKDHAKKLWCVYMFLVWYAQYFEVN